MFFPKQMHWVQENKLPLLDSNTSAILPRKLEILAKTDSVNMKLFWLTFLLLLFYN